MKKILFITLALLAIASIAFAGTIRKNGINQGDLYELLSDLITMVNELKTDHNGLVADMTAASGIKTQFGAYSTSMKGRTTSTGNASFTQ